MIRHSRPLALTVAITLFGGACAGQTSTPTASFSPRPPSATSIASVAIPASPSIAPTAPSATPTATSRTSTPAASVPMTPAVSGWREQAVATAPSAREDHTWTVDGDGAIAYLFGGRGAGGPLNDLWAFDLGAAAWSEINITVDLPVPSPRFGHTATWVPNVGLVVWSGQGTAGFFDDIWAYDPDANAWRQLPSTGAVPPARYGSCASLGPDGELWISHGFTEDSGRFADTRSYSFSSGEWTDRTPHHGLPVERCLHDCFWSAIDQLVLYGGQTTGVPALGDVWAYDISSASWTEGPEPSAPARQLYAMANDGRTAFIFGGGSVERDFLDDTWKLDSVTLELTPSDDQTEAPPARSGAAIILDPASGAAWLSGGTNESGLLGDMWVMTAALP
jgi:hypothetical protein